MRVNPIKLRITPTNFRHEFRKETFIISVVYRRGNCLFSFVMRLNPFTSNPYSNNNNTPEY